MYVVPRRRLVFAVWLTVLALPILVIDNIPRTDARAAAVRTDAAAVTSSTTTSTTSTTTTVVETVAVPETTPETTPPSTNTVSAKAKVAPSTTTTTTTTEPPAPANSEQGGASWYDWNPGECAHKTLPKGTVVTVTSLESGASTSCVVTDRGPYGAGRVIDLDRATFAHLADPSRGIIQVEISW